LLAKAAVLPFSRVGQSLTIPAKAHRRRDPSGEHAVPHDGANWCKGDAPACRAFDNPSPLHFPVRTVLSPARSDLPKHSFA
jgi:hypothetical protein